MGDETLDEVDRAILYFLQRDARRSFADIADELDVSSNTVRNRISDMEESGVLSGYHAAVDYDAADVPHHYIFFCTVSVRRREELAKQARQLPGVTEVITLMTGKNNVIIIGAGDGKDAMTELAYTVDELGLTIEQEHLIRDFVRQPYSGFEPPEYLTPE